MKCYTKITEWLQITESVCGSGDDQKVCVWYKCLIELTKKYSHQFKKYSLLEVQYLATIWHYPINN